MADPSIEFRTLQQRITSLADLLDAIPFILAPLDNAGETNAERATFFAPALQEADLTMAEAAAAVAAIRDIEAVYTPLAVVIAKMRSRSRINLE